VKYFLEGVGSTSRPARRRYLGVDVGRDDFPVATAVRSLLFSATGSSIFWLNSVLAIVLVAVKDTHQLEDDIVIGSC